MLTKTKKVKKVAVVKKKEIKKVASKTVPTKKTVGKKKPLIIVSREACFWVNNGGHLSSMKDLCDALRTMSEEQFIHHTGMGRNDFSAWTLDILGDKKCADDLKKAKNLKDALGAVEKHLKAYSV
jgi:hypothetical protein